MCREAVASSSETEGGSLADGIYWGIVVMLGMPFALVALLAFLVVRAFRRSAGRAAGSAPAAGLAPPGGENGDAGWTPAGR